MVFFIGTSTHSIKSFVKYTVTRLIPVSTLKQWNYPMTHQLPPTVPGALVARMTARDMLDLEVRSIVHRAEAINCSRKKKCIALISIKVSRYLAKHNNRIVPSPMETNPFLSAHTHPPHTTPTPIMKTLPSPSPYSSENEPPKSSHQLLPTPTSPAMPPMVQKPLTPWLLQQQTKSYKLDR